MSCCQYCCIVEALVGYDMSDNIDCIYCSSVDAIQPRIVLFSSIFVFLLRINLRA